MQQTFRSIFSATSTTAPGLLILCGLLLALCTGCQPDHESSDIRANRSTSSTSVNSPTPSSSEHPSTSTSPPSSSVEPSKQVPNNPTIGQKIATSVADSNASNRSSSAVASVNSQKGSVDGVAGANEYIQSTGCRECHADQYDSWHATYHRTMTQEASPQTVLGKFDGNVLSVAGYPAQPFRIGDKFYATLVHPAWDEQEVKAGRDPTAHSQPPPITYAIDRVIGSHHQQVYLSKAPDGSYHTLPIVWDIHQDRWLTRKASFLLTPEKGLYHMTKLWNNGCVFCHNTGPDPGLQQYPVAGGGTQFSWNTSVEELGISCEACHGAGAKHAELHRSLAKSRAGNKTPSPDLTDRTSEQFIVNPHKLSKEESVLNCSRCHGKMIAKAEYDRECLTQGDFFEPGQWEFADRYDHPQHEPGDKFDDSVEGRYFWSDGTPRTTALEYQGVLASLCYQRGEMTCLSCHSMHAAVDPNDQLTYGDSVDLEIAVQNQACTQCHMELADPAKLQQHSHHIAHSSGSLCYNCHMPFQAYSLLKRVRSHRITNPTATATVEAGVPNACNQCHVDQSLSWTHEQLAKWRGEPAQPFVDPHPQASITVAHALSGHALQRALAIEQLGDSANYELAGSDWRAAILIKLLEDDYEANRLLAYRALNKITGFDDFEFDYIGTSTVREQQVTEAQRRLSKLETAESRARLVRMLGGTSTDEPHPFIQNLIDRQNNVPLQVLE